MKHNEIEKPIEETNSRFSPRHGNVSSCYVKIDANTTRTAKCFQCGHLSESNPKLPFFEATNTEQDKYYCGCYGWD